MAAGEELNTRTYPNPSARSDPAVTIGAQNHFHSFALLRRRFFKRSCKLAVNHSQCELLQKSHARRFGQGSGIDYETSRANGSRHFCGSSFCSLELIVREWIGCPSRARSSAVRAGDS